MNANLLKGGAGQDKLFGDGGNDQLEGGIGADQLNGDAGFDAASYQAAAAAVTVYLDPANAAKNSGDAKGDTFSSIENLIGSGFNDKLFGDGNDQPAVRRRRQRHAGWRRGR